MYVQEKNIAKGSTQDFIVDDGVIVLKLSNNQDEETQYDYKIDKKHFSLISILNLQIKYFHKNVTFHFFNKCVFSGYDLEN